MRKTTTKFLSLVLALLLMLAVLVPAIPAAEAEDIAEPTAAQATEEAQPASAFEEPTIAKEDSELAEAGAEAEIAEEGAESAVAEEGAELDTADVGAEEALAEEGGTYGANIHRNYAMEMGTSTYFTISSIPTSYSNISQSGIEVNSGNGVISYSKSGSRVDVRAVRPGTATVKLWAISYCSYDSLYDSIEWTITVFDKNNLATPKITGSKSTSEGLQINWDWVPGAQKYRVYYKASNGWTRIGDTTSTSFLHKGLTPGTTLTYTVRCINSAATQFTSDFNRTGWTLTRYLPTTPKINEWTKSTNGLQVCWKKVEGAVKYRLFKKKTKTGNWITVGDVTDTDCYDFDVEFGKTYWYTVRCLSADGKRFTSDYYKEGTEISIDHVPIRYPQITSIVSTSSGLKFTWDSNSTYDTAIWRLYYKTGNSGWTRMRDFSGSTYSYTDTSARFGTRYTYTIRGIGADGDFNTGFNSTGWTHTHYLGTPGGVTFSDSNAGTTIKWNAVSNAVKYRVFYKNNGTWTRLGDTTGTSFLDRVPFGTSRVYTIRCLNAAANAFTSNYNGTGWSHTHYYGTPTISSHESLSNGVKLSWYSIAGAEKYRVFYKNNGTWTRLGDTTGTSFLDKTVPFGATRIYTVRCLNAAANAFTSSYNGTGWTHQHYFKTPVVTGFAALGTGVKINWNVVPNAEKYAVYYKKNGSWTRLGVTAETSFIHTEAVRGTTYTYTVRCINNALNAFTSSFSNTGWSYTYKVNTGEEYPKLKSVSMDNVGDLKVEIEDNTDASIYVSYYGLYVWENRSWRYVGSVSKGGWWIINPDLSEVKSYYFTVVGYDSNNRAVTEYNENGFYITVKSI